MKFVLLALCLAAVNAGTGDNVGTGCFSSRKLAVNTNYVLGSSTHSAAAAFFKWSPMFMNGGGVKGVENDPLAYDEGWKYIRDHSRALYRESEVGDLGALLTNWLLDKRSSQFASLIATKGNGVGKLTHTPYETYYANRMYEFVKDGTFGGRVSENIAWSSNNRPCWWPVLAWIADANYKTRGHRVNLYNSEFTKIGSNGAADQGKQNWYTQQYIATTAKIQVKAEYETAAMEDKLLTKYGISKDFDETIPDKALMEANKWVPTQA